MVAEKINDFLTREKQAAPEISPERENQLEKQRLHEAQEAAGKHAGEKLKAKAEVEKAISETDMTARKVEREVRPRERLNSGVKNQQYKATMRRVEARLPAYQKVFSKIIHSPIIDKPAAVLGKTVARPSGLMGASIAAFIGLLVVYLNARRIGFEYSAGSTFLFFISVGWLVGILVEYIFGAIKRLINK